MEAKEYTEEETISHVSIIKIIIILRVFYNYSCILILPQKILTIVEYHQ